LNELIPWFFGLLVLVGAAIALWFLFRRRRALVPEDHYTQGLELWLAGDLPAARTALRQAIEVDPGGIDPYLQLGNLLRLTGDAKRAAVLHRNLTARRDIPREKRVSIALSLAEDLLVMQRWLEARSVLDSLKSLATTSPRYWRARFAQWLGLQNEEEAAGALRSAGKSCPETEGTVFRQQFALFQADRALRSCRDGAGGEAKRLLRDVPAEGPTAAKATFIRALVAAQAGDAEQALEVAGAGLLDTPAEMAVFLPALQAVLLESGHFTRTLPILERACQAESAPASLWISLALLYEKLGRREDAIDLLTSKADDPGLTPDTAAPFLKILAAEQAGTDLGRLWRTLHLPAAGGTRWRCRSCGEFRPDVHWFCPACHGFDTFARAEN